MPAVNPHSQQRVQVAEPAHANNATTEPKEADGDDQELDETSALLKALNNETENRGKNLNTQPNEADNGEGELSKPLEKLSLEPRHQTQPTNPQSEFNPTKNSNEETSLFNKDFLHIEHGPSERPHPSQEIQ